MEEPTTLTTETQESDVNDIEQEQPQEQVEESTNVTYDEAWDKVDVDDASMFEQPTEEVAVVDTTPTEEDIQAASDAFMASSPVLKFKGKDIPIDNPEELINLAQKGFKLETEMANIKPQKKVLSTVSDVPMEILQAVADLHSGKQEAFDYLREVYKVKDDTSDDNFFDDGEEAKPSDYKPEVKVESKIESFWNDFSTNNVQDAGKVSEVYSQLESSFQTEIYKPDVFPSFVESIVTGEFDAVYPLAIKEKSLNPAVSWLQAYSAAAQKVGSKPETRNEPPQSATPAVTTDDPSIRNISDEEAAARVWEDDDYFKEMERQVFKI